VFRGVVRWHGFHPWREVPSSIKITGVTTSKYFPVRLGVTAQFITDLPEQNVSQQFGFPFPFPAFVRTNFENSLQMHNETTTPVT